MWGAAAERGGPSTITRVGGGGGGRCSDTRSCKGVGREQTTLSCPYWASVLLILLTLRCAPDCQTHIFLALDGIESHCRRGEGGDHGSKARGKWA